MSRERYLVREAAVALAFGLLGSLIAFGDVAAGEFRPLSNAEQQTLVGGEFAECTATCCIGQQPGWGGSCPTGPAAEYGVCPQTGPPCAWSCSNTTSVGGVCLDWAWDCVDNTMVNIPCGPGIGGNCKFVWSMPAQPLPSEVNGICTGSCPSEEITCANLKFCL